MSYKKINIDIINSYTNRQKSNKNQNKISSPHNQRINNNILDISPSQSMNYNYERSFLENNNNYNKVYMTEEKANEIPLLQNRKNINLNYKKIGKQ